MRYWEIIEGVGGSQQQVWTQTSRITDALRAMRTKQAKAASGRAAAQALPAGTTKSARLDVADRTDADARRVYDNVRTKANDAMTKAMARRNSEAK